MTLSLDVLNHLRINSYSSAPAVQSEIVANAWEADAEMVEISLDPNKKAIVITNDAHGMQEKDVNGKFLIIGYRHIDCHNHHETFRKA